MVMFWHSWAEKLTEEEKKQIEEISYGWAWLNYDKETGTYKGYFYYFPQGSGYKVGPHQEVYDSPPIPVEIAVHHKARFIGLEYGWLDEKNKVFTDLETIAGQFPEEMQKLYERYTDITSGEHIK